MKKKKVGQDQEATACFSTDVPSCESAGWNKWHGAE